MQPRGGVRVALHMRGAKAQTAVAGADGVASFVVPDIATVTIVVDDTSSQHEVRLRQGPVRRIAIAQ
jgi:hypothetical protein